MYFFIGDSHIRQFMRRTTGSVSITFFSGATIRGLGNESSKLAHRKYIQKIASVPIRKTLVFMFGGVDIDVTYYRKLALGEIFDDREFFQSRANVYTDLIESIMAENDRSISKIFIMAPHVSPLNDQVFVRATAKMAKIPPETLLSVQDKYDFSHTKRCSIQIKFNETLEKSFNDLNSDVVNFCRIDMKMIDSNGKIKPEFISRRASDHHAHIDQTFALWRDDFGDRLRILKKMKARI